MEFKFNSFLIADKITPIAKEEQQELEMMQIVKKEDEKLLGELRAIAIGAMGLSPDAETHLKEWKKFIEYGEMPMFHEDSYCEGCISTTCHKINKKESIFRTILNKLMFWRNKWDRILKEICEKQNKDEIPVISSIPHYSKTERKR